MAFISRTRHPPMFTISDLFMDFISGTWGAPILNKKYKGPISLCTHPLRTGRGLSVKHGMMKHLCSTKKERLPPTFVLIVCGLFMDFISGTWGAPILNKKRVHLPFVRILLGLAVDYVSETWDDETLMFNKKEKAPSHLCTNRLWTVHGFHQRNMGCTDIK
ncbi:hypothetical protein CEXT_349791 [Caerostris extrusa]|uniref:Uncharacterized protein n=1 Tax=Caerostris extrusa TaxID=172846 RepID=A0AAV4QKQ8_CAEEX|nr:hypothetical protein CEXT_349791 [Caerostris extrusa]